MIKIILPYLFYLAASLFSVITWAEKDVIAPVHYAYSNYLGSGIYRTAGQNVTLINLPFSYEIGKTDKTTYGLRLPMSFGFVNFDLGDIPNLDFPSIVGTFTFTPGMEFSYQATQKLVIKTYLDYGFANNLTTNKSVNVHSAGVSSFYYFPIKKYDAIWVNHLYYASYNGNDTSDNYAAIETGLDIGLPVNYQLLGYRYQPRVFVTSFWYFDEVNFIKPLVSSNSKSESGTVNLSNSFELGMTLKFEQIIGFSWAGIERLGLSYRYSKELSAFRLIFSFPI